MCGDVERPDDAIGEGCLDCGVGGGVTDVVDTDADDGVGDGGVGEDVAVDTGEAVGT